ncbi:small, acid-soluble spore protein, alpha/beta type [Paenactinomyces guangxiensis]|uniref:Alpha/beta-type small acid-soluble spore protein n=1 Tax=Paenactinomyces guangxiensis TaxID=1490290 RepID=A0A7W1WNR1_9BACL|nr:alpha/beta-type small acid-soluble spore protein [Paenactinomyces guangxiensis]MBA4493153.1 alpha/beta-type small acid-soluble spore protein [Paenactinomyces guangxiensis]MBH8589997.1 alpha/beta-type small acid-soluble spore protein [Paenactinomyces guangxiensis]
MPRRANTNRLLVPGAAAVVNQFKEEIAAEFGVNLGSDTTSRANGSVGGEITKRFVTQAQNELKQ